MPLNPVKAAYGSLISSYVTPLFSQNWNLFAPRPATFNTYVFGRYSLYENNTISKTTNWLAIITPLIEKSKSLFFLGSRERLKYLSNSLRDFWAQSGE